MRSRGARCKTRELPKVVQAGALCSVMGMDFVKVMKSLTTQTAPDKKDPEKILSALGNHLMPKNVTLLFERVKFGFANQSENESIDQYVERLRQLAELSEFDNLCDSLIRDRLVIGTRDSSTLDRLLRERPVPGLAGCIEALQASELSRIHKEQFKKTVDSPNTVRAAEKYHSEKEKRKGYSGSSDGNLRGRYKSGKEKPSGLCKFCGPERTYDRASGKTCQKCGKQGHFAVKCHVKRQSPS